MYRTVENIKEVEEIVFRFVPGFKEGKSAVQIHVYVRGFSPMGEWIERGYPAVSIARYIKLMSILAPYFDQNRRAPNAGWVEQIDFGFVVYLKWAKCPKCLGLGEYPCPTCVDECSPEKCTDPDCEGFKIGCEVCGGLGSVSNEKQITPVP